MQVAITRHLFHFIVRPRQTSDSSSSCTQIVSRAVDWLATKSLQWANICCRASHRRAWRVLPELSSSTPNTKHDGYSGNSRHIDLSDIEIVAPAKVCQPLSAGNRGPGLTASCRKGKRRRLPAGAQTRQGPEARRVRETAPAVCINKHDPVPIIRIF